MGNFTDENKSLFGLSKKKSVCYISLRNCGIPGYDSNPHALSSGN